LLGRRPPQRRNKKLSEDTLIIHTTRHSPSYSIGCPVEGYICFGQFEAY
jgi:hypothetical protein